jgi:hypothetical protein
VGILRGVSQMADEDKTIAGETTPANPASSKQSNSSDDSLKGSLFDKPAQFTQEYFHELREENKRFRLQAAENAKKAEEAEKKAREQLAKESRESLEKIEKLQKDYEQRTKTDEQRIIKGELKTAALQAGLKNIDYLQLFDKSKLKLSEDGEVIGIDDAINDVKTKYPDLFKAASSANQDADAPPSNANVGEKPTYASKAEYEAAKQVFLKANKK